MPIPYFYYITIIYSIYSLIGLISICNALSNMVRRFKKYIFSQPIDYILLLLQLLLLATIYRMPTLLQAPC